MYSRPLHHSFKPFTMPESWRAKLIARLQEHGGIEEVDIQLGIDFLVMADYFTRNDHIGDLATPGEEHYRKNGQEHTLEDVPWKKVLEHVEKQIGRQVPEDRRTEVFNRVMAGMPSRKRFPDWEKPVVPPNENPSTRFSVSKAVSHSTEKPIHREQWLRVVLTPYI